MRLDQARCDLQIGFDQAPVEPDHRAPAAVRPRSTWSASSVGKMIFDAHVFEHPWIADQLGQLVALVRPVEAGRDDDS